MRGRDDDSGEFLGPSRSQQRREALDVLALAQRLPALSEAQLARLPLPETLLPHVREARRITAHVAHKRQVAFLAKQMRREDDATLAAIRDALDAAGEPARHESALLHRAEQWRERLLDEGDAALAQFVAEFPRVDRQPLRQLVRSALDERARGKPPRAFRELFRGIRDAMGDGVADAGPGALVDDTDDVDDGAARD